MAEIYPGDAHKLWQHGIRANSQYSQGKNDFTLVPLNNNKKKNSFMKMFGIWTQQA